MNESVDYKKPRKFNIVVIALIIALIIGAYLLWVYVPVWFARSEVTRVLDETSSEFTGKSSRMFASRDAFKNLQNKMAGMMRDVGVDDPNAEFWIEIDDENQVRFGVVYSEVVELMFIEPIERIRELELTCKRPGRGSGWKCEQRILVSKPDNLEPVSDESGAAGAKPAME